MTGQKWKQMRAKLTPTFTSGRMKAMFPLVLECAELLEHEVQSLANSDSMVNVKVCISIDL
jgi:cytochrome P450 family 6